MPKYGTRSKANLAECDPRIQKVFNFVIEIIDCTVFTGYRDEDTQNALYHQGKSQLMYPNSKHNQRPSKAIDAAPYPIDWKDRERATLFAGFVLGVGEAMGIKLRWGGDWDSDWQVNDNNFDDLFHFELID